MIFTYIVIFTIGEYRKHGFIKVGEIKSTISAISKESAFSTWPLWGEGRGRGGWSFEQSEVRIGKC